MEIQVALATTHLLSQAASKFAGPVEGTSVVKD